MRDSIILGQIWSNAIELRDPCDMSPLAHLLSVLLTVPMITLVSSLGTNRPIAMMDSTELLHGATLGDILEEELGIHVPVDSVVLIEPASFADAHDYSAKELGKQLGSVLTDISSYCASPLADVKVRAMVEKKNTGKDASDLFGRYFGFEGADKVLSNLEMM